MCESKVQSVTLFTDRAKVTRVVDTELPGGETRCTLKNLPASMDIDTLRVRLASDVSVLLKAVTVENQLETEANLEQINKLREKIALLKDQIEEKEAVMIGLMVRINHLDGLLQETRSFAYALNNQKIDMEDHFKRLDQISEERGKAVSHRTLLNREIDPIKKELAVLTQELDKIQSPLSTESFTVEVDLELSQSAKVLIELTYFVYDCSWSPIYHFMLENNKLSVEYAADVTQKTGELWQNIQLELSTATPAFVTEIPDPRGWFIAKHIPAPPRPPRSAVLAKNTVSNYDAVSLGVQSEEINQFALTAPDLEVVSEGLEVSFRIAHPVTLESREKNTKVLIANVELPFTEDLVVFPRLNREVIRRLKVHNDSDYILIPGRAYLYSNTAFVGETTIRYVPLSGELLMNFGADNRINVRREIAQQDVSKKLLQDREIRQFGYVIKLKSSADVPLKIDVHDQIPVSKNEDVKVRLDQVSPKPDKVDDLNRMLWQVGLAAIADKEISYRFVVDYPKDTLISGLPII